MKTKVAIEVGHVVEDRKGNIGTVILINENGTYDIRDHKDNSVYQEVNPKEVSKVEHAGKYNVTIVRRDATTITFEETHISAVHDRVAEMIDDPAYDSNLRPMEKIFIGRIDQPLDTLSIRSMRCWAKGLKESEPSRASAEPKVLDLTPTWSALLPAMLAILEGSSNSGAKETVREQLGRLAKFADEVNAEVRK